MANYDKAELTDREKKAGKNQTAISSQNIRDTQNQLKRQLANYDFADAQNRALAEAQKRQNSRKTSADRFEAQRNLQASALGLMGSMGSAMNGSATGNLMRMLESRNDADNDTYWAQLLENQDQVSNTLDDSLNQNRVARRDAMQGAEKAIRDIEGDWRANMNNINPSLFPGAKGAVDGNKDLASQTAWTPDKAKQNLASLSGYVIPMHGDKSSGGVVTGQTAQRNRLGGEDYFSQLMNRFNGR